MSRPLRWLVSILVAWTTQVGPTLADESPRNSAAEVQAAVNLVNTIRARVHLQPVTLDAAMSAASRLHAEYLRANQGSPAIAGLKAHQEDAGLPGYTTEGAEAGRQSDIFQGIGPVNAVSGFIGTLYHRTPILRPTLIKVGIGVASGSQGPITVLMMADTPASKATSEEYPVAYPADEQQDVPLDFGGETPNPVPDPSAAAGYPITLTFGTFDRVTAVQATLTDSQDTAIPFYLSTPEQPATSFQQGGAVCLIPRQLLHPATTYRVSVTATWQDATPHTWQWSFTTVAPLTAAANDAAAMDRVLGQLALVRGRVVQVGHITGYIFLQIGTTAGRMVSVMIPDRDWSAFQAAGYASPAAFSGRQVQVQGVPTLIQGRYININVHAPEQVRIEATGVPQEWAAATRRS